VPKAYRNVPPGSSRTRTIRGAALMLQETGRSPRILRAMVTSPGGTTLAGLQALEARAFATVVAEGVRAATRASARARPLRRPPKEEACSSPRILLLGWPRSSTCCCGFYMWVLIARIVIRGERRSLQPDRRAIISVTEPLLYRIRRSLPSTAAASTSRRSSSLRASTFCQIFLVQSLVDLAMRLR